MSRILLFSSGLDSTIAYWLERRHGRAISPLYVDLGSRYSQKEISVLSKLSIPVRVEKSLLTLTALEQEDGFVPQRNALLCTVAQALENADEVLLCAVKGEYSRDKHRAFFHKVSSLLSYTAAKPVRVYSPLLHLTKTAAVRKFLQEGGDPVDLERTVSCYHPTDFECGSCMSCVRAWVALTNNNLKFKKWAHDPGEWIMTNKRPMSDLRTLPISQWLGFLENQVDLLTALRHSRENRKSAVNNA